MRNFLYDNKGLFFLLGSILILFFYYGYFDLFYLPPFGSHVWRQTDSASFTWSYWHDSLSFFNPRLMNRLAGEGYAVSELPIIYYLSAKICAFLGYHHWVHRLLNTVIFIIGICSAYFICLRFLKNQFWSIALSLLLFVSPALVFYGLNFIPDVSAFSFSLLGAALYFKFKDKASYLYFILSILFFSIAGMLKATYLLIFLSLISTELITGFFIKTNSRVFLINVFLPVVLILSLVGLWIWHINNYNAINGGIYFIASTFSYWSETSDPYLKQYIFKRTFSDWAGMFTHKATLYLIYASLILQIFFFWKRLTYFFIFNLFILLGSISYYLLWYMQFFTHDYYIIPFYSIMFFSILGLLNSIKKIWPRVFNSSMSKIIFIILLVINALHTKKDIQMRVSGKWKDNWNNIFWDKGLKNYMQLLGIKENDLIVSVPDISPQVSLYLIGNAGFTEFPGIKIDQEHIFELKEKGASYIVVNDSSYLDRPDVVIRSLERIGDYKGVIFYKL